MESHIRTLHDDMKMCAKKSKKREEIKKTRKIFSFFQEKGRFACMQKKMERQSDRE